MSLMMHDWHFADCAVLIQLQSTAEKMAIFSKERIAVGMSPAARGTRAAWRSYQLSTTVLIVGHLQVL